MNFNFSNIDKIINNPIKDIDIESIDLVKEMKENEKKFDEKQKILEDLKKNELDRINFEFLKMDYARRFNISHEEIISILLGENNAFNEISKIKREQDVRFKILDRNIINFRN